MHQAGTRAALTEAEDPLIRAVGDDAVSVIRYDRRQPLPGFLVVFREDVSAFPERLAAVHRSLPPGVAAHCVRETELFQVSLVAFTTHVDIAESIFTPLWIRTTGRVVLGVDLRSKVKGPADPKACLANHLEVLLHFGRNHLFLGHLTRGAHLELVKAIGRHADELMETALLLHDDFDVAGTRVRSRFLSRFHEEALHAPVGGLDASGERATSGDPDSQRQAALDAIWHFEQLVRGLRAHLR
jgi:hypothetical protein